MGITGSRDELRAQLEYLAVAVALPFVGRALGDFVLKKLLNAGCKKCCGKTTDEMKEVLNPLAGDGNSGVTHDTIKNPDFSWSQAAEARGLNKCAALLVSTVVLVCWHWLQPLLYWLCLYLYWDLLDGAQQWAGCGVAAREGIYWLLTVYACWKTPAYLLIDIKAEWESDKWMVIMYSFAPEKFVSLQVMPPEEESTRSSLFVLLVVFDFLGIFAMVFAIGSGRMYPAMMIGYFVTTMGGFLFLVYGSYLICHVLHLFRTQPSRFKDWENS
jgi:hypothetical protein